MSTTKSKGKKSLFDKFYTKSEVAQFCLSLIDTSLYDLVIEPSAGSGSFSRLIPECLAFDIAPEAPNITARDFFSVTKAELTNYKNILVVGNPPFGQQATLAIKFFNHSAQFAKTIAFILPRSFKKSSIQKRLNPHFHLIGEYSLPEYSFMLNNKPYHINSVFQVWQYQDTPRDVHVKAIELPDEVMLVTPETADFVIRRVGGNAGKASINMNCSSNSNYFLLNKTRYATAELCKLINSVEIPSIYDTVGPSSLSKAELSQLITAAIGGKV